MRIDGFFKNDKSLEEGRLITLAQATKYEKEERYKNYIFPVEEIRNGKVMCRPQLKQEVQSAMNIELKAEKRKKRNTALANIYAEGKYRSIDQNVDRVAFGMRGDRPQYNNWQKAKRYHPENIKNRVERKNKI